MTSSIRPIAVLLVVVLVLVPIAAGAQPSPHAPAPLNYSVRPVMKGGSLEAVAVELRFKGSATGATVLDLPRKWGGKDRLYEALSDFSVSGRHASIGAGAEPWERVIHHSAGASLRVRYLVHHADEGTGRQGNPYRPVILPSRMQLLGGTVFVAPHATADGERVEVVFKDFPRAWAFASDLERSGLTFQDLEDSVTVAGDFRVLTRSVRGAPLRVAIEGSWSFTDETLIDTLARISSAEGEFWGDPGEPYLVTLLQIEAPPGSTSSGGTGRSGGFSLFATPNVGMAGFTRTLAHEMLHTWIPHRIGSMPDEPSSGTSEATEYWISEGFTDYYALRMLVRAGVWTPREFADGLNWVLGRYAATPVRTAPNARIAHDFWSNYDVQQLPYHRGLLFATALDERLRRQSAGHASLDDVMHSMHRRFMNAPQPIRQTFVAAMAEQGVDVAGDLRQYIDEGAPILLPEDTFAPCGLVSTERKPGSAEAQSLKITDGLTGAALDACARRLGAAP